MKRQKQIVILLAAAIATSSAYAKPASYNEIHDRVYEKPLEELPFYSHFSIPGAFKALAGIKTELMVRAGLTVSDPTDLIAPPAPKVLHPMGVCADANWEITAATKATGLLSQGTKVPGIVRLSVANNLVVPKAGSTRVIAIGVKLFPTQDKNQPVVSRNFLTADQTGLDGSDRRLFFFGDKPEDKVYFSNKAPGSGFAAILGFKLFDRIDGPSNFRPVYQLADVTANNQPVEQPVAPTELRLVPAFTKKVVPASGDFRDEIRGYKEGELVFDIVMPPQEGVPQATKIGRLTLGKPVVSVTCDQELTFRHHPMNRELDGTMTSHKDIAMDGKERAVEYRYHNGAKDVNIKNNFLFHEVKYFNFASPKISGAMTYMIVTPRLTKQLTLSANFMIDGKMVVVRKNFDLNCVKMADDVSVDLCGEGSITSAGPGLMRTTFKKGAVQWDLTFNAPPMARTTEITKVLLDKTLLSKSPKFIENVVKADGRFFWVPSFRSANVTGAVRIGASLIAVSTDAGYHDRHWGVWNPGVEPMRWALYTGTDSANNKIEAMLAEFPKNSDKSVGLYLYVNGKLTFWPQGNYRVESLETGKVQVTRFVGQTALRYPIDPGFKSGTQTIQRRLRVTTTSGPRMSIEMTTTGAAIASDAKSKALLNEQMTDTRLEYQLPGSELRSAKGAGFYMETSTAE